MTQLAQRRMIGVVAVLAAAAMLGAAVVSNLGDNLVYYVSPTELAAMGDKAQDATVRLGGLVLPGSFDLKKCDPGCEFRVTDGTTELAVATEGLPPQMFRAGIGVVVEGQLQGDVFHTDRVLIKHDNEYKAPTDAASMRATAGTLVEGDPK